MYRTITNAGLSFREESENNKSDCKGLSTELMGLQYQELHHQFIVVQRNLFNQQNKHAELELHFIAINNK